MNETSSRTKMRPGWRLTLVSILSLALLSRVLGAPEPAHAQDPGTNDHRMGGPPVAHVQILLSQIKIFDDRDWGDGEFDFWLNLICHEVTSKCLGYPGVALDGFERKFSAGSGEAYSLDATLPGSGLPHPQFRVSADTGYPLRPDHYYDLRFGMLERDKFTDYEKMGQGRVRLAADNNWGIGTYTVRSVRDDGSAGDYELTFEVRGMVLPDLRPTNITVNDLPGNSKQRICTPVQNLGSAAAGPFEVVLRVNDEALSDGLGAGPSLTPGAATEVCAETELPTSGPFKLTTVVDPANGLAEYNEANNVYEITHTVHQKPGGPSKPTAPLDPAASTLPAPGLGAAQTDLTVSAIKVNGQVPDGKNDCKDGKNDIAVVVKNTGSGTAERFAVRLAVDGGGADEESVNGLEAGKEREVKFGDVRLKKGEPTLTATVDAKGAVAESNEENNERQVAARCKDDS